MTPLLKYACHLLYQYNPGFECYACRQKRKDRGQVVVPLRAGKYSAKSHNLNTTNNNVRPLIRAACFKLLLPGKTTAY
jgi:hypothetical protein